ncbi:MAG: DUF5107 domain-containing protein [Prevotella sp.]|nr:DUF5107 domain-containing protein [Candidatus Prevotella equi]
MTKAWKEDIVIPTYECGAYEKTPIFLENRVYQGSSGVVYPYPVIEKIADTKTDHTYHAVWMENEYIKVMILPELGGRIQMAYDKIRQRHFVYYNNVIKPALVGLAGPWISGGIEFNWPQHHRPSTFLPVDSTIVENKDGSVTVWVNEHERMFGQKGMAGFTLRPGCAYLEIEGKVSNQSPLPQTFLWWANPAVHVNDDYRSIFPPDINAVFDHGKRAVSTFPIATGTYYKMDYSAGVDIANYKNIKVPTSYMGVNSKYNFEGGYENDSKAGMLHVASNHFSPGKKQWTWGNGDFGRAWDRNLTDNDGPYIELMAGVYTENQPDFTWLMPYEEKRFKQYFMPYCNMPDVKNASKDFVMDVEPIDKTHVKILVYATSKQTVTLDCGDVNEDVTVSPETVTEVIIEVEDAYSKTLTVQLLDASDTPRNGSTLLSFTPEDDEIRKTPDAAEAALAPEDTKTNEQLYLTGLHLEQYRHATWSALDYYDEALRRDPKDVRCNNQKGLWLMRRGRFEEALPYFQAAVKILQKRNPNPYDGEAIYNLALCNYYLGNYAVAYKWFWKASWNNGWACAAYLHCAVISMMEQRWEDALDEAERAISFGTHNHRAVAIKAAALRMLGEKSNALATIEAELQQDHFNFACLYEHYLLTGNPTELDTLKALMRHSDYNYDILALHYESMLFIMEAYQVWEMAREEHAMTAMSHFHQDYCIAKEGMSEGETCPMGIYFPNRLEDIPVLLWHTENTASARAPYLLGCLYYDKRQYDLASKYWTISSERNAQYPTVWRNLALYYYNKEKDAAKALGCMEKAYHLDENDARIFMEYDQLLKKLDHPLEERIALYDQHPDVVIQRDDLVLEHATILNALARYQEAKEIIDNRIFHPWEGGEGKVSGQYQLCRIEMAKEMIQMENSELKLENAVSLLNESLVFPHNLGEGKLYGSQDNDIYYYLGQAYEKLSQQADTPEQQARYEQQAIENYQLGTVGPTEPAAALYYNDAKPEKIYYAALCYRALGMEDKARGLFYKLINYGKQHYHDEVKMDYFAVSLPDLLVWDEDLNVRNRRHCENMIALGQAGIKK